MDYTLLGSFSLNPLFRRGSGPVSASLRGPFQHSRSDPMLERGSRYAVLDELPGGDPAGPSCRPRRSWLACPSPLLGFATPADGFR